MRSELEFGEGLSFGASSLFRICNDILTADTEQCSCQHVGISFIRSYGLSALSLLALAPQGTLSLRSGALTEMNGICGHKGRRKLWVRDRVTKAYSEFVGRTEALSFANL